MKKLIAFTVAAAACMSMTAQTWPEAQKEAYAGTRWWWLGSAVDSVNLNKLIDEYARVGIRSVEITPIYGVNGNEANELIYLSPEWMHALRVTEEAAARNGMLVDMNQGTGWPFGGPEIDLANAACKLVVVVDTVAAGANPVKSLPDKERDYATLIAQTRRGLEDGQEEVIRAYESRTRQKVKRAAPGGDGYVLDHFSRDAVRKYLDKYDVAFSREGMKYPHNMFNDSYEVYRANWTSDMFIEFEKRRGYRLQDHLPELLGLVDDGNEVLCDYRETLGELLLENFTEQWADWAHLHGTKVRNQAHGSPGNLIDLYAAVDVPEIEGFGLSNFGIKGLRTDPDHTRPNYSDVTMLKYAASAAHITGKPLTSSETMTWLTEHFRTSLSQMKPELDLMFTCGVNHIFFHGTAYSPVEAEWPGYKFYASVDMSPTNTIWRDAQAMMEFITRSQSFMQEGQPDNDFLVYLPVRDMWHQRNGKGTDGLLMQFDIHKMGKLAPDFIQSINTIDSLGYDCDYISDKYLLESRYADGQIVTPGGIGYKALIVPGSGKLTPQLQAHLDSLSAQGANIIMGVNEDRINAAAESEPMRRDLKMRSIRRKDADGYHYFIANLTPEDINQPVPLAVDFVDAVWFDPMTGKISKAEVINGYVEMKFRSGESRILRVYDHPVDMKAVQSKGRESLEIDLTDNKWELSFIESVPEVKKTFKLKRLQPWTSLGDKQLDILAGTGVYTTTFDMDGSDFDHSWSLELGDVRESARVYINDEYVGTAWAVPFTLDITDALKKGKNKLRIEVTNLPANRIAQLDREGVEWRKFKEINFVDINYKKTGYADWTTMPSGLNSTVMLIRN